MTRSRIRTDRCPLVITFFLTALLFASSALSNAAALKLNRNFSDNMVVQRDKPVTLAGSADKGAEIVVTFAGQKKTVKAGDEGRWTVTLDPMPASAEGRELRCQVPGTGDQVVLKNVVVGDVILFARQTSIDLSLGRDKTGEAAAEAHKADPRFRAISIKTVPARRPRNDLAGEATQGWVEVSRASALGMTAGAYYLGRDLVGELGVPVGILDLNLGSAFPISWLSREALEETEKIFGKTDVPGQLQFFDKMLEAVDKDEPMPKGAISGDPVKYALFPAGGYNAVLHPLKGLALKAAVVQLGNDYPYMIYAALEREGRPFDREALNRAYVDTYNICKVGFRTDPATTPRIPRVWRDTFGEKELPFGLIVPPGSDLNTLGQHHREMRELQRLMAEDNPAVGVILPGSDNIPYSAQPRDEALLAKRCLNWVRGAAYGESGGPATGPLLERVEGHFNEATIHFKQGTARGLRASGDALATFEAAGVEGDYVPVEASIDGEMIRLKSDTLPRIVRVRYNWNKRPNQELVNAAGLPAMPFRSEKAPYHWFVINEDSDLPEEYFTPANEWTKSDVTLVNGQLKTHGYDNFTGWIGPVGIRTGPFGPNMGVREVKAGSPAEGKILVGDFIYSANGHPLGDKAWEVMAAAITGSETKEAKGRLVMGLRRDGENLDVEVTLKVMGTYSSTAPYDCPKTDKIITELENWVVAHGDGAGFLNADALFLLASGNPEYQGHVRRVVYKIMEGKDPSRPIEPTKAGKSWHNSAEAILLGEYYLATGDRKVLPHLKHACDRLAATQNELEGGWRHNYPGGPTYGLIPNAGLPGVMGMHFAKEAGLDINRDAYHLGLKHFGDRRAETGYLIYGFGGCQRDVPAPFDPEVMAAGQMNTYNGGLSAAGILMGLSDQYRAAHLCSLTSAFAWNNTFYGHGGNFWNNFWTPLGAHQHGKQAFIHFWENHRWYRECNRMYDGSLIQHESGKVGAGPGVALVAPRRRIQIVGAPPSPFATDAPAALKPALAAYWKKDYAGCEKRVKDVLAAGIVAINDRPTVEYLERAAREIQMSIVYDLERMQKFMDEGQPDQARADLAQLKAVMPDGDERLAALEKDIASAKPATKAKAPAQNAAGTEQVEEQRTWQCLVSELAGGEKKGPELAVQPDEASVWKIKVVEGLSQAPQGWTKPTFDDAQWGETTLPISWRMYHTALLRTTFTVKDRTAFDGLRFHAWLFRQQGIEIYLNGELIGKVNNLEKKTGDVDAEFKESALKHLKNGENTLAITTRHNWRWGMLFMKVYNDGFDFNLDARLKKEA